MSTEKSKKIKEFLKKYEDKIVLFLGVLLISVISFQLGVLQGEKWQQSPLVIEKVPDDKVFAVKGVLGDSSENIPTEKSASSDVTQNANPSGECVLIGSKNSDKYHKMDCRWADQIKLENRVCFKSEDDAKSKGYVPASCLK